MTNLSNVQIGNNNSNNQKVKNDTNKEPKWFSKEIVKTLLAIVATVAAALLISYLSGIFKSK
jgi:amino acid permease